MSPSWKSIPQFRSFVAASLVWLFLLVPACVLLSQSLKDFENKNDPWWISSCVIAGAAAVVAIVVCSAVLLATSPLPIERKKKWLFAAVGFAGLTTAATFVAAAGPAGSTDTDNSLASVATTLCAGAAVVVLPIWVRRLLALLVVLPVTFCRAVTGALAVMLIALSVMCVGASLLVSAPVAVALGAAPSLLVLGFVVSWAGPNREDAGAGDAVVAASIAALSVVASVLVFGPLPDKVEVRESILYSESVANQRFENLQAFQGPWVSHAGLDVLYDYPIVIDEDEKGPRLIVVGELWSVVPKPPKAPEIEYLTIVVKEGSLPKTCPDDVIETVRADGSVYENDVRVSGASRARSSKVVSSSLTTCFKVANKAGEKLVVFETDLDEDYYSDPVNSFSYKAMLANDSTYVATFEWTAANAYTKKQLRSFANGIIEVRKDEVSSGELEEFVVADFATEGTTPGRGVTDEPFSWKENN